MSFSLKNGPKRETSFRQVRFWRAYVTVDESHLTAADDVGVLRQEVGDFALALVAPLRAEHDRDAARRHGEAAAAVRATSTGFNHRWIQTDNGSAPRRYLYEVLHN